MKKENGSAQHMSVGYGELLVKSSWEDRRARCQRGTAHFGAPVLVAPQWVIWCQHRRKGSSRCCVFYIQRGCDANCTGSFI
jgi:hypothetical protein